MIHFNQEKPHLAWFYQTNSNLYQIMKLFSRLWDIANISNFWEIGCIYQPQTAQKFCINPTSISKSTFHKVHVQLLIIINWSFQYSSFPTSFKSSSNSTSSKRLIKPMVLICATRVYIFKKSQLPILHGWTMSFGNNLAPGKISHK